MNPLVIGIAIGFILDHWFIRIIPGLETLEHEFTHAVAAKLMFRKITRFKVTAFEGGSVSHKGKFGGLLGDDFIGLAPYLLPTFTVVFVLFRPVIPGSWFPVYDGIIGFTIGYHTWSTVREFMRNLIFFKFPSDSTGKMVKSDLAKRGILYSFTFISVLTLIIHSLLFYIILFDYGGLRMWGHDYLNLTIQYFGNWFI